MPMGAPWIFVLPKGMDFKIKEALMPHILAHEGYVPGEQPDTTGWIKLNTNENPYPPSPRISDVIASQIDGLRLYASPDGRSLRKAISIKHGLSPDQVILGNGSDDVLNVLARAFCGPGHSIGIIVPSYSLYPLLASLQAAPIEAIEFDRDFNLPIDSICNCSADIFFMPSPHAPSGKGYSNETLCRILEEFPGLLVIDEAYADFAETNAVELLVTFPNLFITRTFSKSYALAGLRVGYGLGSPDLIRILHGVRDVYNVDLLAQAGAQAAIEDVEYFEESRRKVLSARTKFLNKLEQRGWVTYPSQANFVFTAPIDISGRKGPAVAASLFQYLKAEKILIRYFPNHSLTESFLRVTIGTDSQMETLNRAIDQWMVNV
jgi:histidinol-phosphate aminotransferase